MIQLFVKKGDGGTVAVRVSPSQTVGSLKSLVLGTCNSRHMYFSFAGRPLPDDARLMDCGIQGSSSLGLGLRVLGGGGDGGATGAESRDCYLNMYAVKKPDKVDPNEIKLAKFTNCALTSEPLKPPCVIDLLVERVEYDGSSSRVKVSFRATGIIKRQMYGRAGFELLRALVRAACG